MSQLLSASFLLLITVIIFSSSALNSECPAIEGEISETACSARTCSRDSECGTKGMCCSNGCVLVCMIVESPLVFDWIEDTPEVRSVSAN